MNVHPADTHSQMQSLRTSLGSTRDISPDTLLTVDDVAHLLKVSRSWVYEHTRLRPRRDSLASVKIGKYVRFTASAVAEYIARHEHRSR